MIGRSWAEVDLSVIENNYKVIESMIPAGQQVMAVVKANGYGHGDIEVATRLYGLGCRAFAVSNLEEGKRIRSIAKDTLILILGYTPIALGREIIEYDITACLPSEDYAKEMASYLGDEAKNLKAQFALDTGMNRIGLDADHPEECEAVIRKYKDVFDINGLFTHLCVADTPSQDDFTNGQIEKFKAVKERVKDLNLPYVHCLNTAGGMYHNEENLSTFTRLGISLYGLKPDSANILPEGIKPAMTWKSTVALIKTVHPGETLGYGRRFTAEKEMQVATVPTGYADGYHRALSGVGHVLIHGKKAPILGRVCMDQMMVDVTEIPEAKFEDEVILFGQDFTADDMADLIGTIGYELVCDVSGRVPRVYK